ncbi:MAG: FecR family protein [Paludibacter sp.]|nr:FecR family protein [Paludibacter sp.]
MKIETDNLLARYFGGNASDKDMLELEQWISLTPENQLEFDKMTSLYEKMGGLDATMPDINTETAKEKFKAYISAQKNKQPKPTIEIRRNPFYKTRLFQAASITLFFMLSFSVWKIYLSDREIVLAARQDVKQEILNDQTQVDLSKNSKITYSSGYSKNNKIIKLEGEANFKVGHKGTGKLQVVANETFIEDIGTVFAVTAYPDSNYISVKVREGQVHFYTKENKGLIINSSETGVYNKQTKTFKVLAQKLDKQVAGSMHVDFQAMVLKDAIDIISNAYKVNIKLADKSINNRKITVNFDGEDVNVVLQIIAQTLDLDLQKVDNAYLLSTKKNKN